jgi:hypothetical protein
LFVFRRHPERSEGSLYFACARITTSLMESQHSKGHGFSRAIIITTASGL